MKLCRTVLLPAVMLLVLCACGGDTGRQSGSAALKQAQYVMQVTSPPATGVQANRPFTVMLQFVEPNNAQSVDVGGIEAITASVISGPGSLNGTTTLPGNGTSSLTFSNLAVSAPGTYVLRFNGLRAKQPATTASFVVGAARSFRFTSVPGDAIRNRVFSIEVETYDPFTGAAAAPSTPVAVTLSLVTGSGNLGGTVSQTLSTGSTLVFGNLTYDQVGQIALKVSSFAFPDAVTPAFVVDSVVMTFTAPPVSVPVNSTFSLSVNLTGQYSGRPIEPKPTINATLGLLTGGGALTGATTQANDGARITFPGLRYDQLGTASFSVTSSDAATANSAGIAFGLQLRAGVQGKAIAGAGGAFGTVEFRLVDGAGTPWAGTTSLLDWSLRDSGGQLVQSGQAAVTGGIAGVTPAPMSTPDAYTLTGSITAPLALDAQVALGVSNLTLLNQPGTFVALKSVRENHAYSDSVSHAAPASTINFGLLAGALPPGLSFNGGNGEITGTPTTPGAYSFTLYADLGSGNAHALRCALAVFRSDESEIVPGQDFKSAGAFTPVGPITENWSFTSSFDGISYPQSSTFNCRLQYYYPNFATAPATVPVFIQHRGRGFDMMDYDNLGAHLASHGIAYVSVEDYQSFFDAGASGQGPNNTYDATAELGMESASAFQEAAMRWLVQVNAQTGHPFFGHVDAEKVFVGGHSRGGGATQASHVRSQPYVFNSMAQPALSIRGAVYFMGYDLRAFSSTAAGNSNLYPIPVELGRVPSLLLSAENDRDLFYPICDQFIDRATGQATFATIYGGCHNYMGDTTNPEPDYSSQGIAPPYITRAEQQERAFNLVVAFIKRWADLDVSLEGLLYNNELAGSQEVGVTAWRNMNERVVIDDYQAGNKLLNTLGGANSLSNGTWTTSGSVYPSFGAMGSLGVRHNILTLGGSSDATYTTTIPASGQNLSSTRRVIFRLGQVDQAGLKGFDWVTLRIRLTDNQSDSATITVFDKDNQHGQYLPDYAGSGGNVFDRFVEANVPLSEFSALNQNLSLNQLVKVELIFQTSQGNSRQFYVDDLRFE